MIWEHSNPTYSVLVLNVSDMGTTESKHSFLVLKMSDMIPASGDLYPITYVISYPIKFVCSYLVYWYFHNLWVTWTVALMLKYLFRKLWCTKPTYFSYSLGVWLTLHNLGLDYSGKSTKIDTLDFFSQLNNYTYAFEYGGQVYATGLPQNHCFL